MGGTFSNFKIPNSVSSTNFNNFSPMKVQIDEKKPFSQNSEEP